MRVFKTAEFARLAKKAKVDDRELIRAAVALREGTIDADLGAHLVKQRVSAQSGRKNAHRAIVVFVVGSHVLFLHLFAKNRQANLSESELDLYRELAGEIAKLDESHVTRLVDRNAWIEVTDDQAEQDLPK
ncbi:type II toxin-antitoxin system RelE/ParE family toxin [Fulvimarina sp. MAC8]|uniref:type II toxin-antitoxin system RelE/ParE family toxin n=1 Tax=Fulvimarina sp. MAC8 TaxID=3162874 RepID=UPI0032F03763